MVSESRLSATKIFWSRRLFIKSLPKSDNMKKIRKMFKKGETKEAERLVEPENIVEVPQEEVKEVTIYQASAGAKKKNFYTIRKFIKKEQPALVVIHHPHHKEGVGQKIEAEYLIYYSSKTKKEAESMLLIHKAKNLGRVEQILKDYNGYSLCDWIIHSSFNQGRLHVITFTSSSKFASNYLEDDTLLRRAMVNVTDPLLLFVCLEQLKTTQLEPRFKDPAQFFVKDSRLSAVLATDDMPVGKPVDQCYIFRNDQCVLDGDVNAARENTLYQKVIKRAISIR